MNAGISGVSSSPPGLLGRMRLVVGALGAAILGVAPHVLHHVGPLAGAALFAGLAGTLLFGVVGFILTVPMLLKIHRNTGTWRAPAAALALMAVTFSLSAFVVGPAIAGGGERDDTAAPVQAAPRPGQPQAPANENSGHAGHH